MVGSKKLVRKAKSMIGRQNLLEKIDLSITPYSDTAIFYIKGAAGMGKTRFLEEIGQSSSRRVGGGLKTFLWSKIIDLYHVPDPIGLIYLLAKNLEPNPYASPNLLFFGEFMRLYKEYKERSLSVPGESILGQRSELIDCFLKSYTGLAIQEERIVITFDTIELLQYEKDKAQKLCHIDMVEHSVLDWFIQIIPQLSNTTIVLAGRPDETIEELFVESWGSKLQVYALSPLNEQEVHELVLSLAEDNAEARKLATPVRIKQINALAKGRPIYIGIILELLHGTDRENHTFSLTAATSDEIYKSDAEKQEAFRKHLAEILLSTNTFSFNFELKRLACSHRGLDAELLAYLSDNQNTNRAEETITELQKYVFVKSRPDSNQIYFHDELYDLFDETLHKKRDKHLGVFESIRDFYLEKRDLLLEERSKINFNRGLKEIRSLTSQIQQVNLDYLFYALQCDPEVGYQTYVRLSWDAIVSINVDYDMKLRSVFLRFVARYILNEAATTFNDELRAALEPERILYDSIVRWIRRYAEQNNYKEAHRIINLIETTHKELLNINQNILSITDFASAKARAYPGLLELHDEILGSVHPRLEKYNPRNDFEHWLKYLLTGYLFNRYGIAMRQKNRWTEATIYYNQAIASLRQTDAPIEMANATNNLSFVYALLGAFVEAKALVQDALENRTRHAQNHPRILSLNTQGRIWLADGMPIRAEVICLTSLNELNSLGLNNTPAEGFIYVALGEIGIALSSLYFEGYFNYDQSIEKLDEASEYLRKAEDIFAEKNNKVRLFQVRLYLGRLNRERMQLFLAEKKAHHDVRDILELAETQYDRAYTLARGLNLEDEMANVYQDLALLYEVVGNVTKSTEYVLLAEELIPEMYKPRLGFGFQEVSKPVNNNWLILGDIYLTKARIVRLSQNPNLFNEFDSPQLFSKNNNPALEALLVSTRYHILAAACYEMWSPFPTSMKDIDKMRIQLYGQLRTYGLANLQQIIPDLENLFHAFNLTENFSHIKQFVKATLVGLGLKNI